MVGKHKLIMCLNIYPFSGKRAAIALESAKSLPQNNIIIYVVEGMFVMINNSLLCIDISLFHPRSTFKNRTILHFDHVCFSLFNPQA